MIFYKKREELSSSWPGLKGSCKETKASRLYNAYFTSNSAVFAVWCSSFRISHSLKTTYCPTGSIYEALEHFSAVPALPS